MHAYGSARAYVDHYLIEGNIAYGGGPFLIGGGRPSQGLRVRNNALYGVGMQLGYMAPHNEDCEVRGNVIADGGLSINKFKQVAQSGNLILAAGAARPKTPVVIRLRANRYDPKRAHLAVFNWAKAPAVDVPTGEFFKHGDEYRLLNPRDFYGPPLATGRVEGPTIRVPLQGEFAAFVVLKR